jgi:type II secretory pathway pseudopilin PulG
MTLSGASTVEELIPGNPAAIEAVVQNVGSGVGPARQIAGAWQMMTLPGWEGRGGNAWRAFTPKEAGHVNKLPPAFNRVAAAMLRYQSAFQAARAEAQAAINDAKTAEHATRAAKQEHQDATRKAATADPGTPEATVPPFTDPGATGLVNARTRLDTARTALARVGDEVAAEIRAAAGTTSGASPALNGRGDPGIVPVVGIPPGGLPKPNPEVWEGIGEFLTGFFGEAWDTVVGLWDLLPIVWLPQVIEELFTPEGWERQAQKWDAFVNDPGGVLGDQWDQIWKSLTYADLWKDHPGQASGRVTFAALAFLLPLAKLGKFGKLGTVGELGGSGLKELRAAATQAAKKIADGHAFGKHVIKKGEFPGVSTPEQFAKIVENVVAKGEVRQLNNGRVAFWKDGVLVVFDPKHPDGGTAFRPVDGYDYFLDME